MILVVGAIVTVAYFVLHRSIQPRSGEFELPGLSAPVEVTYDDWAIPRIHGATREDVARGQGFVHASDRLWQLEFFLRVANGRLAEIFGETLVETDRLLRTLDLWGAAGRELGVLAPADRAHLDAYAAGVNAKIERWRGPWPLEFMILGIEPQPWSAQATLAIGRIMSLDLSGWRTELSRIDALARLDAGRLETLAAGYPAWGPTILQDTLPEGVEPAPAFAFGQGEHAPGVFADVGPAVEAERIDPLSFLAGLGFNASNSWVVGGSRTADGHPLLANDMHLSLRAPSTWYLNGLQQDTPDEAVVGLSIAGTPGVIVGLNRHVAWAFTNAMVDDADFIVESVNLDDSMYREADDWVPFETREEVIHVRGRDEPDRWIVRSTSRGPVMTDVVPAGGLTLSLQWTGREPGGAVAGIFQMNEARSAASLDLAIRDFRNPHQNVMYATTEGRIGYRMSGSVPERAGAPGAVPISFDRLPEGWPGFWPADSMPSWLDPSSDYLASGNNLQSRAAYGRVGVGYPAPFRARRIDDLVSAAQGWTTDDMRRTQLDSHSLWGERYRDRAVRAARRAGEDSLAAVLEAWDLTTEIEATGAAPFFVWLYRLRDLITADEYDAGVGYFPDLAFLEIVDDPSNPWIDDARTPEVETLAAFEEEAARVAATTIGYAWGEVHQERSAHPLGQVPILDRLFGFNVGPYPSRGGRHTVRPGDPSLSSRLDSTAWRFPKVGEYGPSERFVAHLTPERPRGYFLLPTGQSGNPLDRHYRDMSERWRENRLIELSPGVALDDPASTLRLVPAR